MSYTLGIDFGTSGARAIVLNTQGLACAELQTSLPPSYIQNGACLQNPMDWWQALDTLMRQLAQQIDLQQLDKLLIDGTSSTVLLADAAGSPLTPARMYNDNSAHAAAAQIVQYAAKTSPAQGISSSLAKALALLHDSDQTAAHILHQTDWLLNRLCGRFGHTDYNNALKLGYDPRSLRWEPWLSSLIDESLLPQVHAPATPIGKIAAKWAQTWACNPQLQILTGTTDSTASFLATGATENGDAVSALGSSLVLKILSPTPIFAPDLGIYSHKLGEQWLLGGASNSGGAVLAHYFSPQTLQNLSAKIDINQPCTLDYYPLLRPGERFPINDASYAPRLSPRPPDDVAFLYALLSGISRIEKLGYQSLVDLGAPALKRVFTTGGGANNPIWTQIRQRDLQCEVLPATMQQAAYGSALLAFRAKYSI